MPSATLSSRNDSAVGQKIVVLSKVCDRSTSVPEGNAAAAGLAGAAAGAGAGGCAQPAMQSSNATNAVPQIFEAMDAV